MFVKVYEYYIKENEESRFLEIQEETARIYKRYLNCEISYLKSSDHDEEWLEISRYSSEEDYLKGIQEVDKEPIIKDLFQQFKSCLVPGAGVKENNYIMKLNIGKTHKKNSNKLKEGDFCSIK